MNENISLHEGFINDEMEEESIEIVDEELIKKQRIKELQSKIGRRSKQKGAKFENDLRTKIASYFGMNREDCFVLAKNHPQEGQSAGDLIPVKKMAQLWHSRKFDAIEAKNREEWAFSQFFNGDIKKNPLYKYWIKSNVDTNSINSLVFFKKNNIPTFVFHERDGNVCYGDTFFQTSIEGKTFIIQTLGSFLKENFPL